MPNPVFKFAQIAARDLLRTHPVELAPSKRPSSEARLSAAMSWLCRAQDVGGDRGVSYGYSLRGGWRSSYVETTGYIACTFFDVAKRTGSADHRDRAIDMCRWLCAVQLPGGSFTNDRFSPGEGIVFDTGQDLLGLERAYAETGEPVFEQAADRAADWLVRVAGDDGRWTRYTHNGIPHVYNTRVAWALLLAHGRRPSADRERVARANLDWALTREQGGYFEECAFTADAAPFTHNIAYAIRGLLESARLLSDSRYQEVAERAAQAMTRHVSETGFVPGQIDSQGRAVARYACLTGSAQLSIIWSRLRTMNGDEVLGEVARRTREYVARSQDVSCRDDDTRGAIKGSQPIWGRYSPFTYPNWATKFFVDALLAGEESLA